MREWNKTATLNVLKMNPTSTKLKHFFSNFRLDMENSIAYKKVCEER